MADDNQFNTSASWWDSSARNSRFDSGSSSSSSSGLTSLGSFAWPTENIVDVKGRSSMESVSAVSDSFHDTQKLQQGHDSATTDLHMMGLGLSSQPMDWNQALL